MEEDNTISPGNARDTLLGVRNTLLGVRNDSDQRNGAENLDDSAAEEQEGMKSSQERKMYLPQLNKFGYGYAVIVEDLFIPNIHEGSVNEIFNLPVESETKDFSWYSYEGEDDDFHPIYVRHTMKNSKLSHEKMWTYKTKTRECVRRVANALSSFLFLCYTMLRTLNPFDRCRGHKCCQSMHINNRRHYCQCRQCQNTAFNAKIVCLVLGHSTNQEENAAEKDRDADEYYDISSISHTEDDCAVIPRSAAVDSPSRNSKLLFTDVRQTLTVAELHHRRMHSVLEIFFVLFIYGYFVSFALYFLNLYCHCMLQQKCLSKCILKNEEKLPSEKSDDEDADHKVKLNANSSILISLMCLLLHNNQLFKSYSEETLNTKKEKKASDLHDLLKVALKSDETRVTLKQLLHTKQHPGASYPNEIIAYPAYRNEQSNTLNSILERFSTPTPPNRGETMSFELLRLCTLHDFPVRNSPSLVRLTQAGFYYEGNDDEVICFACHARRRNWQVTDDPMSIHRQMSPDCPFILNQAGNQAGNIPVSYNADLVDGSQTATAVRTGRDLQTDNESVVTASSLQTDSVSVPAAPQGTTVRDCARAQSAVDCAAMPGPMNSATAQGGNIAASQNRQTRSSTDSANAVAHTAPTVPASSARPAGNYQAPRTVTRAKYPEYSSRPTRLATYSNWPQGMTQHPRDLTEAGFFFTGNGDCARCFHCGIGLKNWDPSDNPWVEHARWSQSCAYLLQIKGQDFIDLVMDAAERAERGENPASSTSRPDGASNDAQPLESDQSPGSTPQNRSTDTNSVSTTSARDNSQVPKFPLQAPAPQSVISQGYSPKVVKLAVDSIINKMGWLSVTADSILKEINDSGYATASASSEGATASSEGGHLNQEYQVPTDKTVLRKENKELKELTTCKICLDAEVTIVFLPCGHLVSCAQCSPAMRKCPICRTLVKGTVRTSLMEG